MVVHTFWTEIHPQNFHPGVCRERRALLRVACLRCESAKIGPHEGASPDEVRCNDSDRSEKWGIRFLIELAGAPQRSSDPGPQDGGLYPMGASPPAT